MKNIAATAHWPHTVFVKERSIRGDSALRPTDNKEKHPRISFAKGGKKEPKCCLEQVLHALMSKKLCRVSNVKIS